MTKQEFEQRINSTVCESDYDIIEYVYNFHPSIDEVHGKDDIANIYKIGGMRIIRDMEKTAKIAESIYLYRRKIQDKLSQLKDIEDDLKSGIEMDMNVVIDCLDS